VRTPNSNLKEGPCGQLANGRTDKVSVFAPGDTIEVTWRETTNHRSYYRVAFDADGDDAFPTFAGSGIGADGIDPSGPCPVDGRVILAYEMDDRSGGSYTLQVRLPDVECERCTLQVVQFMYDTMTPYYFQCADLALRRPGAADAGLALDAGSDAAAAPASPPSAAAAPGCWSQIAPDGARPGARDATSGDDRPDDDTSDESAPSAPGAPASGSASEPEATPSTRRSRGGCTLEPPSSGSSAAALLLLIGGVTLCRARRPRRA
jgi:hypothetical protein